MNVVRPTVSVARVSDAAEPGTAGRFRFTRTGDVSAPLTVTYTVEYVLEDSGEKTSDEVSLALVLQDGDYLIAGES